MPMYVQAKMENTGELFLHCGSKEVAGRNSNIQNGAGEHFSLVYNIDLHLVPNHSASLDNITSVLALEMPAYEPLIAAVFNAVNQKDVVSKLVLNNVDRAPTGGTNKILSTYTATDGRIVDVTLHKNDGQDKAKNVNEIIVLFQFEKIVFDDNRSNTSGEVQTNN
ncbi:hypothetical protein LO80_03215 [Candidatus Francisella endociliophora]|uniref:Uncharacterized protein n=1 Tax=Candidatus Francisella endociliophora TaxID=653937 RepID=A0A097ENE0_9GAMM|nr:hypothetical protein [Francisella sp. FSC1006]AIT09079.1 hypothetical protein LO80_03215 [Francisella sp. FSC1006]